MYQEYRNVVVVVVIVVVLPKVSLSFCSFNDHAVCSVAHLSPIYGHEIQVNGLSILTFVNWR